jgi:hypothetical protein
VYADSFAGKIVLDYIAEYTPSNDYFELSEVF